MHKIIELKSRHITIKVIRANFLPYMLWFAFSVIFFILTFHISGFGIAKYNVDNSWQLALDYAVINNLQFGKDIVFTYGPLGFLFSDVGLGNIIETRVIFAFAWSLIVTCSVLSVSQKIIGIQRYFFMVWALLFCTYQYDGLVNSFDHFALLIIIYGGFLLIDQGARKIPLISFLAMLSALSLVKFTFFVATLAIILISFASLIANDRNFNRAMIISLAYVIMIINFWSATGQQIGNLLPWIKGSLEISSGYDKAMSMPVDLKIFLLCFTSIIILLSFIALRIKQRYITVRNSGLFFMLLFITFIAWKQGFVRANDHTHTFILFEPFAFAFLCLNKIDHDKSNIMEKVLPLVVYFICAFAMYISTDGKIVDSIVGKPAELLHRSQNLINLISGNTDFTFPEHNHELAREKMFDLPVCRSHIGNATVDVMNYQQSAAIINKFNYHPRPVIQGYSTYTPYLQALNRSFYQGILPPEYLLLDIGTIDNRLPTLDDAPTLLYVLKNYMLITQEKGMLLLRRKINNTNDITFELIKEHDLQYDEILDLRGLNENEIVVKVEMKPTILGKIVTTLYHSPILELDIYLEKSKITKRFIPEMAITGFLLNPLLINNADIINYYQNKGQTVTGISFLKPYMVGEQISEIFTVKIYNIQKK